MSHQYRAVTWNRQKRIYDVTLVAGIVVAIGGFCALTLARFPQVTAETLLIRALGATAFCLLTLVLSIGPLARLTPRALTLLYNRRHLGVATFLVAAAHGVFALVQFHALGDVNPIVSLLSTYPAGDGDSAVAFQIPGFLALLILFAMAATSHDFWLANLSAPVWKALHMSVYVAFALVVAHVAFGAMQAQQPAPLLGVLAASVALVATLNLLAGARERNADAPVRADAGWVTVCAPGDIDDGRARVVLVSGERVAVFRNGQEFTAMSAVCQHQNGPLGEGCIIDGLVTCPWHGFQYDPRTGASPAPFTEKLPTFDLRLVDGVLQVHEQPNTPGHEGQRVTL